MAQVPSPDGAGLPIGWCRSSGQAVQVLRPSGAGQFFCWGPAPPEATEARFAARDPTSFSDLHRDAPGPAPNNWGTCATGSGDATGRRRGDWDRRRSGWGRRRGDWGRRRSGGGRRRGGWGWRRGDWGRRRGGWDRQQSGWRRSLAGGEAAEAGDEAGEAVVEQGGGAGHVDADEAVLAVHRAVADADFLHFHEALLDLNRRNP